MTENENALGNKNRRLLEHWVLVYIILDFQIWFLNPKYSDLKWFDFLVTY